jgi:hypothetical protein
VFGFDHYFEESIQPSRSKNEVLQICLLAYGGRRELSHDGFTGEDGTHFLGCFKQYSFWSYHLWLHDLRHFQLCLHVQNDNTSWHVCRSPQRVYLAPHHVRNGLHWCVVALPWPDSVHHLRLLNLLGHGCVQHLISLRDDVY